MKFLIFIVAFAAIALTISYAAFKIVFYSPLDRKGNTLDIMSTEQYAKHRELIARLVSEAEKRPFEAVSIRSFDGTELFGRYYHIKDGAPLQIQFHGYRGSAFRDFSGGSKLAMSLGQNVLLVDQRAHGKSGGTVITFGIKERYDCARWVDYAIGRFGPETEIILAGVSMGAATVLMAAGINLPQNVKGIIADCPFSSPSGIIKKVCKDRGLPPRLVFPFIKFGAKLFGRFDIGTPGAEASVTGCNIPILLIHGDDDRFVPFEMSEKLCSAAGGRAELAIFHGAGHGLSYIIDPARYEGLIKNFLRENLG